MWKSKKKLKELEKRIADLEKKLQNQQIIRQKGDHSHPLIIGHHKE